MRETLVKLVGEQAGARFARREALARTQVGRAMQAAADFLKRLSGQLFPLDLRTANVSEVTRWRGHASPGGLHGGLGPTSITGLTVPAVLAPGYTVTTSVGVSNGVAFVVGPLAVAGA